MAKRPQQSKSVFRNFLVFLFVFILLASILSIYNSPLSKPEEVPFNTVVEYVQQGKVKDITITEGADLTIQLNDPEGTTVKSQKEGFESLPTVLQAYGVTPDQLQKTTIIVKGESGWKYFLVNIFPILLPAIFIILFFWMMLRQVQGTNNRALMFGQLKNEAGDPEKQKQKINFKDVAGATEAKEELTEVVDFLKYPKKYLALGARIPKGVLLMGPPGTGKTLLARAVAGEANVPFFHISGSEFVEMFVGVGASRVRDLFKKAKKNTPCIVFIDEIDAVGRKRGAGLGGSHDEREQTLNQILVEMDGFDQNINIIVMAATNRPDVLDSALLRPGRFDRQVVLDNPDIADREAILKIHARKKPLAKDVSLRKIAERTPGFSGADLANILNEGAILTARRNKKIITMDELFESIEKVMLGPERKSRVITVKEKKITAYHEGGHAIVAHFLPNADPVHKISIIARGRAGGYTLKLPTEDKHMYTKREYIDEIAVLLGGYLTEKEIFGEVTTGATSDLRRATSIARRLITDYGMSEKLGPRTFGEKEEMIFLGREIHEQKDYSEKIAEQIDEEIAGFIKLAEGKAKEIIKSKKDVLEKVVARLLKTETIEREEFEHLVGKKK